LRTAPNAEERTLIKGCLKGNRQAQLRLYNKYVQAMYNIVIRMHPNPMDAEDILQDSFVKVFKNLSSFSGEATLGAWIKRIVINTCLNFLRKNKRLSFIQMETTADYPEETEEEKKASVDMATIHHAVKKLPEGCRVIFSLHLLEGYQHKEIAKILDITESTSKSQYHRARRLLRKELKKNVRRVEDRC
jgi:RNA polymerase sigma-70 factor (ECF subfamily)